MSARKISTFGGLVFALVICLWARAALAATGYEVYWVQPGDNLRSIAQRFGVEAGAIAEFNGLAPDAPLAAGRSLNIPAASGSTNGKAQEKFAAEEKQASDVAATELSIKPAVQERRGPVVGYLGIALEDTTAVVDPRGNERLCSIARGTYLCVSCQYGDCWGIMMSDGAVSWVPKKVVEVQRVELVAGIEAPAGARGSGTLLQAAFRYYGLPYVYGGTPPGPTDCSGFVQAVFRDCGIALPRTAAAQFMVGYAVPLDRLTVGDRVYFISSDGNIGHAGLYIGNGQFVHASSRRGYVAVDSLRSGFYRARLAGARRP